MVLTGGDALCARRSALQALQQLDVRGEVAGAWWAACWARVSALLPSGLVLPAHVGR